MELTIIFSYHNEILKNGKGEMHVLTNFNWWKDLLFLTFMTNVINKIHKDKWSERMKQFYSNTFRRITPSSVGRLIELNVEA